MLVILSLVAVAGAAERPRIRDRESPRATDLLRAESLATQVERRRKLPARRSEWVRGGGGWGKARRATGEAAPKIVIKPPALRRSRK
jgi:hypothetical protein